MKLILLGEIQDKAALVVKKLRALQKKHSFDVALSVGLVSSEPAVLKKLSEESPLDLYVLGQAPEGWATEVRDVQETLT